MSTEANLQAYLAEAASWDADRAAQARRSARLGWAIAIAGWFGVLATSAALAMLLPLKEVEPFVIRVDNATGIVDVVPVYAGEASGEEALTRYFLTHYVTVCERFNFSTAESDYEECGAFHTPQRNQLWYAQWVASNPASPLNVFKDGTTVGVQIKSVSFFTRASGSTDLAQVRYVKAKRQAGGVNEEASHWIATVQYAFGEPATDPKIRRWNPLGFKVVEFRSEPEVFTESATNTTAETRMETAP